MRLIGQGASPIGHAGGVGGGGASAKIGDIVFAAASPGASYLPIVDGRVYAEAYSELQKALTVYRENDGSEWLQKTIGDVATPDLTVIFQFGGTAAGRNVLMTMATGGSGSGAGVRLHSGPANALAFDTVTSPFTGTGAPFNTEDSTYRMRGGAVNGNTMLCAIEQASGGALAYLCRSVDGGQTWTYTQASTLGLVTLNGIGGNVKIVAGAGGVFFLCDGNNGHLYRSVDDGLTFAFVRSLKSYRVDTPANTFYTQVQQVVYLGANRLAVLFYQACDFNNFQKVVNLFVYGSNGSSLLWSDTTALTNTQAWYADNIWISGSALNVNVLLTNDTNNVRFRSFSLGGSLLGDVSRTVLQSGFTRASGFEFDGYYYVFFTGSGGGLYRCSTDAIVSASFTAVSAVASGFSSQPPWPTIFYPRWALLLGSSWSRGQMNVRNFVAQPAATARPYFKFVGSAAIGASRTDGKLPFMRAK